MSEIKDKKSELVNEGPLDVGKGDTSSLNIGGNYAEQLDAEVVQSMKRKLDFRLLPLVSLMYLFNSVDRSNLGNAKTDGLEKDLHMVGNQYSITLVVFYVTFCTLDIPLNLLTKRFSGKVILPSLMIGWGSMTLLQCSVTNWGGLLTLRLLMGGFEAGFFAGVTFYLTLFYKRDEIAFRMAIFYGSATIAGAFSGLLAFGVFQVNDPNVPGWKWLMIIEGGATLLTAIFAYWHLPRNIATCRWLTVEERAVGQARLLADGTHETDEKFNLASSLKLILDWRIFVWSTVAFCYGVATTSVGNFMPQMVARLGYSTVKTNLYTVAPYCVGCVVLLAVCYSSDYFRERSFHLAFCLALNFTGFMILTFVDTQSNIAVAYFACFMLASGAYAPSCLFHTWHNNNEPSENGRAAITGFMVGANNSAGIVSSLAFAAETAPKYLPALIVAATFQAVGIVIVISLGAWLRWDNRRRDKFLGVVLRAADVRTELLVGRHKDARWRWTT